MARCRLENDDADSLPQSGINFPSGIYHTCLPELHSRGAGYTTDYSCDRALLTRFTPAYVGHTISASASVTQGIDSLPLTRDILDGRKRGSICSADSLPLTRDIQCIDDGIAAVKEGFTPAERDIPSSRRKIFRSTEIHSRRAGHIIPFLCKIYSRRSGIYNEYSFIM